MKLRSKISKKILAIGICTALVVGSPLMCLHASALVCGVDYFYNEAPAYCWSRSDIRSYLNGTQKINNTLPVDTTYKHTKQDDNQYYESHFSNKEYSKIRPWTYYSDSATTDKFTLPSGNGTKNLLSWGDTDISNEQDCDNLYDLDNLPNPNLRYIIPKAYRADNSWLRSSVWVLKSEPLSYNNGEVDIFNSGSSKCDVCSLCKMSLYNISFASAASAKAICNNNFHGSRKIDIDGGLNADYGMYLKELGLVQNVDRPFSINTIEFQDNKTLSISYSGDPKGKYLVVQIFPQDSSNKYTCYMAAGITEYSDDLPDDVTDLNYIELDISNWGFNDSEALSKLDGYTAKVWLEDDKEANLAAATEPITYLVNSSEPFELSTTVPKNLRMFALRNQLRCSWGDLGSINKKDTLAKIINNNTPCPGATNQKIYFGTDSNGNPLQFWIAGLKDSSNKPIEAASDKLTQNVTMCLYQAKPVEGEKKVFNYSNKDYLPFKPDNPNMSHEIRHGIDHFVVSKTTGTDLTEIQTRVQILNDAADNSNIIWMQTEHKWWNTWYGLDIGEKVFPDGSRRRVFSDGSILQITWRETTNRQDLSDLGVDQDKIMSIEDRRYSIFDIKVIAPTGETYTTLEVPVNLYVQIGTDWDKNDLEAYYVGTGVNDDQKVSDVTYRSIQFLNGVEHDFAVLPLKHYSPYIVYDKLTDVERQALKDGDKTQALAIKTGDETTPLTLTAGIVLACSFCTVLTSYTRKRRSRKRLNHNHIN